MRLITGSFEAGCTDVMACNYDPIAEVSDGSCLFVGQNCSDGLVNTINDVVTENCQCEGEGAVYGCTNPLACNYGAEANVDDGSCCNCSGDSLSAGDLLYFENFDDYNVGDAISEVSQAFDLWPVAGATDAYVSDEAALSGTNSLKIEGQLTGGPMDVVLTAGLEGIQSVKFNVLVPIGSSGYYNVQENIVAAIDWAFECYLGSDGIITFAVDPVPDGSSGPELSTTYNYGDWVEINHVIDTDADLMDVFIDGSWVGELPYDGEQFGGVNFYAAGDGVTLPLYYVDDISVEIPGFLPGCNGVVQTPWHAITYQARLQTMAVAITIAWVAPMLKRSTMTRKPQWTMALVCTSPRLVNSLGTLDGQGWKRGCIRIQRYGTIKALRPLVHGFFTCQNWSSNLRLARRTQ